VDPAARRDTPHSGMPGGRGLPAVTKNRNYPQPVKHLKPAALGRCCSSRCGRMVSTFAASISLVTIMLPGPHQHAAFQEATSYFRQFLSELEGRDARRRSDWRWMTSRRLDEKVDSLYRPGLEKVDPPKTRTRSRQRTVTHILPQPLPIHDPTSVWRAKRGTYPTSTRLIHRRTARRRRSIGVITDRYHSLKWVAPLIRRGFVSEACEVDGAGGVEGFLGCAHR
jgi:hypothetical protein